MKNMKYKQIKKGERYEISILLSKGYSIRDTAKVLKRDAGSLSREIQRNRSKKTGKYDPKLAQQKASVRRRLSKYQGKKINDNTKLKEYVIYGLGNFWSPDEISGRMRIEKQLFYSSKTAIYEWMYSPWGQRYCSYLYSQRYIPRKRRIKTKKTLIPNKVSIKKRPKEINLKLNYGHFEGDTIVSDKQGKGVLSVIYARKERYINALKISSLKPEENNKAIKSMAQGLNLFLSLTLDNGIENTRHEELQKDLGVETFFCDPYSSWQKGGIENANKMIRRFIPKGSDISKYSKEYISSVCDILNHKPRKSLGYKTPYEIMLENKVLKEDFKTKNRPQMASLFANKLSINKSSGVAVRG